MARLILSMFMSLDGFVCGPNGEFITPEWSDDLEEHWSGYAMKHAGRFLYVETGLTGTVDEFRANADGSLTRLGSVTGLPPGLEGITTK